MSNTSLIITLLLLLALALSFTIPAHADPQSPVPWGVDCDDGVSGNGFYDRGFCVPGIITHDAHFVHSPSRFWGVGSSYAPGVMERMCRRNGGCEGFKGGVAVMSCGDVGRTAWIKISDDRPWYGPLKVVDCSQPFHMYVNVAVYGLAVEWGHRTTEVLGEAAGSAVRVHLGGKPSDDEWGWYYPSWWINNAMEFESYFSIGIDWELRFWLCFGDPWCPF